MSMSDCEKCWDTPCTCGYHWRNYSKDGRIEQAAVVLGIDPDVLRAKVGEDVPNTHPLRGGSDA